MWQILRSKEGATTYEAIFNSLMGILSRPTDFVLSIESNKL